MSNKSVCLLYAIHWQGWHAKEGDAWRSWRSLRLVASGVSARLRPPQSLRMRIAIMCDAERDEVRHSSIPVRRKRSCMVQEAAVSRSTTAQSSVGLGPNILIGWRMSLKEKSSHPRVRERNTEDTLDHRVLAFPCFPLWTYHMHSRERHEMQCVTHMHTARASKMQVSDWGPHNLSALCGMSGQHCKCMEADRRNAEKVHSRVDRHPVSESRRVPSGKSGACKNTERH